MRSAEVYGYLVDGGGCNLGLYADAEYEVAECCMLTLTHGCCCEVLRQECWLVAMFVRTEQSRMGSGA